MREQHYISKTWRAKDSPLNFISGACKVIAKELGGIEKLEGLADGGLSEETIDKIVIVLQVLIAQGCAYKNMFEIDAGMPIDVEHPATGEDGRFKALKKEELEMVVGFEDISAIITAINECVTGAAKTEIRLKLRKTKVPRRQKKLDVSRRLGKDPRDAGARVQRTSSRRIP